MVERLILVVSELEFDRTKEYLNGIASSGWSNEVKLIAAPARKRAGDFASAQAKKFLDEAEQFGAQCLIIAKDVCCDQRTLDVYSQFDIRRATISLLRQRLLRQELSLRGLLWKKNISEQLEKWAAKRTDVDHWLEQFDHFGIRFIGENLLRQLEIIGPDELNRAFILPAHSYLGQRMKFAFVPEMDPAASSNRIGAILVQLYGKDRVCGEPDLRFDCHDVDRIILCEDALWTGNEACKIIEQVASNDMFGDHSPLKRIDFRHALVTDFGLLCCRQFIEKKNLVGKIDFILDGNQKVLNLISPSIREIDIKQNWHLSPRDFERWISNHVEPLAFRNKLIWRDQYFDALNICQELGHQLITKYVEKHDKNWPADIMSGFSLGAHRFGAFTVFSHSIPKTCLPLIWLGGRIKFGHDSLEWLPLLYDARRFES
ncbi:hypothetical protein [Roseomonas sp. CECT 9278]|uniref:phosphoribosyltransferase-like protein n=1 Tax=Roseomonas sp. CECT 9278 TaxID=2845823 RepID=UPI001E3D8A35|nr:hypothetical protein [Roseomonas sp. CECT 9278]CAH0140912.1 hypothetical protein ROS9278_00478 [Roseomonas sp. CECT 9278]